MAKRRLQMEEEELIVTLTQQTGDAERAYARERMRRKRQNPEFVRREKAADRARRRLAKEHPHRFMELMDEELKQ